MAAFAGNSGDAFQFEPGYRKVGYIADQELQKLCREQFEKNSDWQDLACELNYVDKQIQDIKKHPASEEEKMLMMVKRWHEVIIDSDYNENAQKLLKEAFAATDHDYKSLSGCEISKTIIRRIQEIDFCESPTTATVTCHNLTPHVTDAGEGMNIVDGAANQFKKHSDETLTKTSLQNIGKHMDYVGALISEVSIGTVFRVGSKYVMTAAHVVTDVANIPGYGTKQPDYSRLEADTVFINFNENPNAKQEQLFKIKSPPVFIDSEVLDIAVLEIANPKGLPPSFCLRKEVIGGFEIPHVSLAGHGHPNTPGLRVEIKCNAVSQYSQDIIDALKYLDDHKKYYYKQLVRDSNADEKLVESAYSDVTDPHKMPINIFMEKGASGGPIIDYRNPETVYVIGVLTHGLPKFLWNIPLECRAIYPKKYRFEMAARMSSIYSAIDKHDSSLARDLFGLDPMEF